MYSRYHGTVNGNLRLPENYSGCAFSQAPQGQFRATPEKDPRRIEIASPSPPPKKDKIYESAQEPSEEPPAPPPAPPQEPEAEDAQPASLTIPVHKPSLLGSLGIGKSSILSGFGFEELLLLGLILLLLQSEEGHDTVLWLVLLLFCG